MNTLNLIGCGHVGKTLAYLWNKNNVFAIQNILTRSRQSSKQAIDFIGAGTAVETINSMQSADIYLIATPDDQIMNASQSLLDSKLLKTGNIVFQCSGSIPSTEMAKLLGSAIQVASVHPVKSFANPSLAIDNFDGTFCAIEGHESAIKNLRDAFERLGGITFNIDAAQKTNYHAANVIVCNYLTALLELGLSVYEQAGVPKKTAMQIIEPLVRETVDNNFKLGTIGALTGPIARGDVDVVERQIESLSEWQPDTAELYKSLGRVALMLSKKKGTASSDATSALASLLKQ